MVKKLLCSLLLSILIFTGCSGTAKYPEKAMDGSVWDRNWTMLGSVLGVEESEKDFTLLENPVILTGDDTFYATWTYGEANNYVNAEGKDTDLYPAEIYLLLFGCEEASYAKNNLDQWLEKEYKTYDVQSQEELTINNQSYTIINYKVTNESNPNAYGISAFTLYNNYAVSAELTCTEAFDGDAVATMKDFLSRCHYAKE